MAHQRFMYNVFVRCLKTAKGIVAVNRACTDRRCTSSVHPASRGVWTWSFNRESSWEVTKQNHGLETWSNTKEGSCQHFDLMERQDFGLGGDGWDSCPWQAEEAVVVNNPAVWNDDVTAILNQVQVMEHASVTMGTLHGSTRTGGDKQMKFDQFFDLLIAQAYTMEENVRRRNQRFLPATKHK